MNDRLSVLGIFTADTPLAEREAIIEAARQYVRLEESRKRSERAKMAWAIKRAKRLPKTPPHVAQTSSEGPPK